MVLALVSLFVVLIVINYFHPVSRNAIQLEEGSQEWTVYINGRESTTWNLAYESTASFPVDRRHQNQTIMYRGQEYIFSWLYPDHLEVDSV